MDAQRSLLVLAVMLSAAIALALALIDGHWEAPPPHRAEVPAPPGGDPVSGVSGELLVDIAARPLFLPGRRPPEPEPVDEPEAVAGPHQLDGVALLGIYGSGGSAGVLLGKDKDVSRLRVGGEWQGWRLLSIGAADATLIAADGETKTLVLERQPQQGGMVATPVRSAKPAAGTRSTKGSAANSSNGRPSTPAERRAALRAARINQSKNKD